VTSVAANITSMEWIRARKVLLGLPGFAILSPMEWRSPARRNPARSSDRPRIERGTSADCKSVRSTRKTRLGASTCIFGGQVISRCVRIDGGQARVQMRAHRWRADSSANACASTAGGSECKCVRIDGGQARVQMRAHRRPAAPVQMRAHFRQESECKCVRIGLAEPRPNAVLRGKNQRDRRSENTDEG
jgi:hypothetical protein